MFSIVGFFNFREANFSFLLRETKRASVIHGFRGVLFEENLVLVSGKAESTQLFNVS